MNLPTSFLFVPADRPDRFIKAINSGANAIIVDLEDSVADADKAVARQHIHNIPKLLGDTQTKIWLRINAPTTPHYADDVALIANCPHLTGIVLPKAEHPFIINALYNHAKLPILAVIETAQGLGAIREIAQSQGVAALSYGVLDLVRAFGLVRGSRGAESFFNQVRYELLLASRLANLPRPIESIFANFKDSKGLAEYAHHAYTMGFGGQLCIHPSQINLVNASYQPSDQQRVLAQKILKMHKNTNKIAFAIDGVMVDLPLIDWAKEMLNH